MAELLRKSDLSDIGEAKQWELVNTVNGFRSHNAADRVVHFEFFLAAENNNWTRQERQDAWTIHHVLKEAYADYILLRTQYDTGQILWANDGAVKPPDGTDITIKGNAKLMHLAQKVFRKTRRGHDKNEGPDSFTIQSVQEISKAIAKKNNIDAPEGFNNGTGTFFTAKNWGRWEKGGGLVKLVRPVHEWVDGHFIERKYNTSPDNDSVHNNAHNFLE